MPELKKTKMPGLPRGFQVKYSEIFQRNIGLFSQEQQRRLETASVTVVGPRSLCCVEALTLARFGIKDIRILIQPGDNMDGKAADLMGRLDLSLAQAVEETTPYTSAQEMLLDPSNPETMHTFIQGSSIVLDLLPMKHLNMKTILAAQARAASIFYISAHPLNMGCAMFIFHPEGIDPDIMFQKMSKALTGSLGHEQNAATCFLKAGMAATEAALILTGMRLKNELVLAPRFLVFNALERSFTIHDMSKDNSIGATT